MTMLFQILFLFMSLAFCRVQAHYFSTITLNLDLSDSFLMIQFKLYGFVRRTECLITISLSVQHIGRHPMSMCLFIANVNIEHVVEVSVRFLHCKVTNFSFRANKS